MTRPATGIDEEFAEGEARPLLSGSGYQRLKWWVVLATATVALVPLFIITLVSYSQHNRTVEASARQAIKRLLTNNKQSIEFFLAERRSALSYIIRDRSVDELWVHCGRSLRAPRVT